MLIAVSEKKLYCVIYYNFRSRYVRSPGILEPATLSPECSAVSCRRFITETPGDGRRDVACKIVPLIPLLIKRALGPLNSNRPVYIANKLRICCIVCQLATDWRIIINLSLLTKWQTKCPKERGQRSSKPITSILLLQLTLISKGNRTLRTQTVRLLWDTSALFRWVRSVRESRHQQHRSARVQCVFDHASNSRGMGERGHASWLHRSACLSVC